MSSHLDSHTTTDVRPDMLSGVQTGNGNPHVEHFLCSGIFSWFFYFFFCQYFSYNVIPRSKMKLRCTKSIKIQLSFTKNNISTCWLGDLRHNWWAIPPLKPVKMAGRVYLKKRKSWRKFRHHMIDIKYAALPMCAHTEKTTFSGKDDCTLTNLTWCWT